MTDDLLQRVADELEIRNLIYRLAMLADDGDLDEYVSLFTADGLWERRLPGAGSPPTAPIRGRDNLLAAARQRRADGVQGPGTHMYHCIVGTAVKLQGDAATARSYLTYLKNANDKPEVALLAIYSDEFVRTSEGWRLAARHIDPG